ncbi:MAG: hypothetical protein Q9170_001815 [Blastenia crenularia]
MGKKSNALHTTANAANLGPVFLGIDWAVFSLSTIVVLIRLFTRGWVTRNVGWDEALIALTQKPQAKAKAPGPGALRSLSKECGKINEDKMAPVVPDIRDSHYSQLKGLPQGESDDFYGTKDIVALNALSVPPSYAISLPSDPSISSIRPNSNLTARKEWLSTPFISPYNHQRCALNFVDYGPETRSAGAPQQMNQALDALIYRLMRSGKDEWGPGEPPILLDGKILSLRVTFLRKVYSEGLALALQALRDPVVREYWPREIVMAEFGLREPWRPLARFSLRLPGLVARGS